MTSAPGTAGLQADLYGLDPRPLYGEAGGSAYNVLCRHDPTELSDVLRLAQGVEGPLLELACGSGRLTLPLASRGQEVVALDSSAAMLALLARRVRGERIRRVEADMATFALDESFALILLASSSVCLLDPAQRVSAFTRVRAHLAPGGVFYVSGLDLAATLVSRTRDAERVTVFVDGGVIYTLYQYFQGRQGRRTTSLLRETVVDRVVAERALFTSQVAIVDSAVLEAELCAAGLTVVERRSGPPTEQVHVQLICRAAGDHDG